MESDGEKWTITLFMTVVSAAQTCALASEITTITLRKGNSTSDAYIGASPSVPWTFRVLFPAL